MENSMFNRNGAPVSIGQYLTLELQARQETLFHLADRLECPEEHLRQVIEDAEPLTAHLALKIERCWGICMKLLLDLQQEHQQWVASTHHPSGGDRSPEVG